MRELLVVFFLLSVSPFAVAKVEEAKVKRWEERKQFTAKDSTEAKVTFSHWVEIIQKKKPSKENVLNRIDEQLWHLFGPLSEARMYAVPKADHQVKLKGEAERKEGEDNVWVQKYTYTGTMQIKNGDDKRFKIILPNNPKTIYDDSAVDGEFPCTDDHYDSKDDFWYFWNPKKSTKCPLRLHEHYEVVDNVEIQRIPNTPLSYPDYRRFADQNGVIKIHFLMGLDDPRNSESNRNPNTSNDLNAVTFRETRAQLKDMGFKLQGNVWTTAEIKEVVKARMKYEPFVETFARDTKRLVQTDDGLKPLRLEVRLFFGTTGIDEDSNAAFHYFYRDALANAALVIYDGHSGLGGHLDLSEIEKLRKFKIHFRDGYQVLFINSCTSYTYYNNAYFERKGGTKDLDILVNGLATEFGVMHDTNMALVKGIDLWADKVTPARSYQDLAKTIDSANLFSVNGDEDNPKAESEL